MKTKIIFLISFILLLSVTILAQEGDIKNNLQNFGDENYFIYHTFNYDSNFYLKSDLINYSNNNLLYDKKDPLFAAALSWYVPGLGLLYTENWIRGFLYYSISNFLLFYTFSQITNIQYSIQQFLTFSFNFYDSQNKEYDSETIAKASFVFLSYLGVRLISIVDSAFTAYNYNLTHKDETLEITPSPFIAALLSWLYPGLGQIYIKEYTTGSIFILLDFVQKLYIMGLGISKLYGKTNIDVPSNDTIPEINWNSLSIENKIVIVSYLTLYIGNRLVSSILAYTTTKTKYVNNSDIVYIFPVIEKNKVSLNIVLKF